MKEIKKHEPGTFCWVDLGTTDAEGAKKFYTKLFGLTAVDSPAGPHMVYTELQWNSKQVAGLYAMNKEQPDQGIPPHWNSYVTVENVDTTIEKVKALGGTVILEPFDVFDAGRTGMFQDPTGAFLAVWQPKEHIGAAYKNIPGTLCWNELGTKDTEKAKSFFSQLFGWNAQTNKMGDMLYTSFMLRDQAVGGMYQISEEMGDIPPHWLPYFAVEDCDQTVSQAKDLRGSVLTPPMDIEEVGRFAVLKDPQGAVFAVIKLASS